MNDVLRIARLKIALQRAFLGRAILIFTSGQNHKNSPKKRSLNRDLLNFLNKEWCIKGGIWWILMSRRFRICMAKGGRGSLRPSYGQPKLTLISRFVAMQIRCHEKLTLFYFWSDRFETNRTWGLILGLHVLFVSKRSDQKYKSVSFLWHLWFFVTLPVFGLWPHFERL